MSHNRYATDELGKVSQQGDPEEPELSAAAVKPSELEQVLVGSCLCDHEALCSPELQRLRGPVREAHRVPTKIAALHFSYALMFGFSFPSF